MVEKRYLEVRQHLVLDIVFLSNLHDERSQGGVIVWSHRGKQVMNGLIIQCTAEKGEQG